MGWVGQTPRINFRRNQGLSKRSGYTNKVYKLHKISGKSVRYLLCHLSFIVRAYIETKVFVVSQTCVNFLSEDCNPKSGSSYDLYVSDRSFCLVRGTILLYYVFLDFPVHSSLHHSHILETVF